MAPDRQSRAIVRLQQENAALQQKIATLHLDKSVILRAFTKASHHCVDMDIQICGLKGDRTYKETYKALLDLKQEHESMKAELTKVIATNYEHLQHVIEVRDQLLGFLYEVLDRPTGIPIEEMPKAISELNQKTKHYQRQEVEVQQFVADWAWKEDDDDWEDLYGDEEEGPVCH